MSRPEMTVPGVVIVRPPEGVRVVPAGTPVFDAVGQAPGVVAGGWVGVGVGVETGGCDGVGVGVGVGLFVGVGDGVGVGVGVGVGFDPWCQWP
jgi:hypothetical protein